MANCRILTRRDVERLIAAGDTLVIAEGHVLRLNSWQHKHPGGRLVIQHMVGRDATAELSIFHTPEILNSMRRHRCGRIEGDWINLTPPIQGGVFTLDNCRKEEDGIPFKGEKASLDVPSDSEGCYTSSCDEEEGLGAPAICRRPGVAKVSLVNEKSAMPVCDTLSQPDAYTVSAVQQEIDDDIAKYPSLEAATQRDITVKYQALHQRIRNEGFYRLRPYEYAKELARYSLLFGGFILCLTYGWYATSACFLGLFWHQIMFTAHDAGHLGITHNFVADTLIGIFIGNFCCGLSIGWWKSSHNVHHLVTNDPVHDPDIQNVPLFATSPAFFGSIRSSYYNGFCFVWDAFADIAVQYQKYTYYPVMAVARFNLYFLSWAHLCSPRSAKNPRNPTAWTRPTEILAILCYMFWYFYVVLYCAIPTWWARAVFLVISHLITMPLHVQITLSHWGTSTADLGAAESFPQRQLRTTMDVACPAWLDFIHGGLQFQAVHHLFPRVPRHNLRRLQVLVKEFCVETGIEYLSMGFVDGNRSVLGRLQQVADQAKIMVECQAFMAKTGESGLH